MKSIVAALALLLTPCCAMAAADRAVWIWEKESYAMLENRAAAKDATGFFKSRGINTLYLYADSFQGRNLLVQKPQLYRKLIRRMRKEGIRTYALLGSAYLNTEEYVLPARHPDALAMLKRVLDYNAGEKPEDRFSGVNLDIEPHILDQWKDRKNALLLEFLDMGRKLMDLKKASGAELAIGPAVPFWLDRITLEWEGNLKPVSEHAADIYDYLALMDYRDRAEGRDGIIAHAALELKYAAAIGRKVIIGVETGKNEIKKVSFYHLKAADMERELAAAEKAFAKEPAFAGFVIHHYRTYRNWLESQDIKN